MGRRPRIVPSLCAATLAALATAGCGGEPSDPVVLGAIYDLSGSQAGLDLPSSRGARLAIDEIDRAGGVLGRPVRLELVDGESDPATAARGTAELLRHFPRAAAVFGLSDTDMVLAAAPAAAAAGRLFLTSGATSPLLPAEVPDYLYLACFGDNVQAAAGAEWAYRDLGARTAVVLFDGSMTYTRLLHGYFETAFTGLGGKVVRIADYRAGDPFAGDGGTPEADLVYLAAGPDDAAARARQVREAGIAAPILGGDGLDVPASWHENPDLGGVYFTTHAALGADAGDARAAAFRAAYSAAYGGDEPDAFAALGYDAAYLLVRAVADAGTDDPEAVRRALAAVHDFTGITGRLSYEPGERIPRKEVTIVEVGGGETRPVRRMVPSAIPAP